VLAEPKDEAVGRVSQKKTENKSSKRKGRRDEVENAN
jgi:hypothetical protein